MLGALVVLGIGIPAAYFQWRAPSALAELQRERAAIGTDPESRLDAWTERLGPEIQRRMLELRFSSAEPWLVTHVVDRPNRAHEVWGIDFRSPSPVVLRREGRVLVVQLASPSRLASAELSGPRAESVAHVANSSSGFDGSRRAAELAEWALHSDGDLIGALEKDVPGATIAIRCDPTTETRGERP